MNLIELKKIEKSFGKNKVLKNINLELPEGEVVAVMGPNGSGKTTMLKSILGLVIPDSGKIYVKNKDSSIDFNYRKNIGYMPQTANYPDNLKVSELFHIVKDIRGEDTQVDEELVEEFRLREIYNKYFGQLSGGYKQRVTGAIAFLFKPEILILDEPTASLDPLSCEIMRKKIMKEKTKKRLIIITSHISAEAEELADRLIYILEGKIFINKLMKEMVNGNGTLKLGLAISKILENTGNKTEHN